eukprot:4135441-Alexandrium_andersonii.AAC.1
MQALACVVLLLRARRAYHLRDNAAHSSVRVASSDDLQPSLGKGPHHAGKAGPPLCPLVIRCVRSGSM